MANVSLELQAEKPETPQNMNELDNPEMKSPKRRRWGFWVFVVANVAGLLLVIPLLTAVFPLVSIWWNTRSQESFKRHRTAPIHASSTNSTAGEQATAPAQPAGPRTPESSLGALTNNLHLIGNLKDEELNKIVAYQYGKKKQNQSDPTKFDRDSAVFHSIKRTVEIVGGKESYCYEVDLVDQNGNHRVQLDRSDKPDLDYERSIATLDLVNSNPQLKKIYQAFAHVLGEQAAASESGRPAEAAEKPAAPAGKAGPPEPP